MPQGGFSRDFQRAALLKTEAQKRKEAQERKKIGDEVYSRINPELLKDIEVRMDEVENNLILKQDETIAEFIDMMKQRNRLLKFLLWTNVLTLLSLSFTLGYFL
jgi:predicted RecB family nuclease|tara:strand:- start:866 stop:1177 length:312 start_codon:yes stop_codon:yes gene_type:complete